MSSYELRSISDGQLCNTYKFEGLYSGKTGPVVNEVSRRGLDCYGVRGQCKNYGFKEGTSDFARCVMDSETSLSERTRLENQKNFNKAIKNLSPPVQSSDTNVNYGYDSCRRVWVSKSPDRLGKKVDTCGENLFGDDCRTIWVTDTSGNTKKRNSCDWVAITDSQYMVWTPLK